MQKVGTLQIKKVKVSDLHLHPLNTRQGDVGAIIQSLETHGQYRPVVVQKSSMNVIAGNHTLMAASSLGWATVDATLLDVDDDQALRILLVDNRTNDLATYDSPALIDVLEALVRSEYGLSGSGFDGNDLDELIATSEFEPELEKPAGEDLVTAPPEVPITKTGDVWLLGPHRLVCGDSTKAETYASLMGTDKAEVIWTDPPYGVEYVGKTKDALTIKNDGADGLDGLLKATFSCWEDVSIEGAAVYIAHPAGVLSLKFLQAFVDTGWRLHQTLCWNKETIVLGHSDYHYSHEPILFGYLPGGAGVAGVEPAGTATTRSAPSSRSQSQRSTRSTRP